MTKAMKARLATGCLLTALSLHATAAERTFTCRNWIDRDWPRTLLHYDIQAEPGDFEAGKVAFVNDAGEPVECQVVAVEKHADGSLKKGRCVVFAGTAMGTPVDGQTPFWVTGHWQDLLGQIITGESR